MGFKNDTEFIGHRAGLQSSQDTQRQQRGGWAWSGGRSDQVGLHTGVFLCRRWPPTGSGMAHDCDVCVSKAWGGWSAVFKHGKSVHRETKIVPQTNGRAVASTPAAFSPRSLVPSSAVPNLPITSSNRNEPLPSTFWEAKRLKQDKWGSPAKPHVTRTGCRYSRQESYDFSSQVIFCLSDPRTARGSQNVGRPQWAIWAKSLEIKDALSLTTTPALQDAVTVTCPRRPQTHPWLEVGQVSAVLHSTSTVCLSHTLSTWLQLPTVEHLPTSPDEWRWPQGGKVHASTGCSWGKGHFGEGLSQVHTRDAPTPGSWKHPLLGWVSPTLSSDEPCSSDGLGWRTSLEHHGSSRQGADGQGPTPRKGFCALALCL